MSRDYRLYLDDIQTSCEKIVQYAQGLTFEGFIQDAKTFDAMVRNLEIIGEAVKHVPDTVKANYPDVDWRRIGGLRDVIAHGYFGLNEHIVWDLVQNRVPDLLQQIRHILAREG